MAECSPHPRLRVWSWTSNFQWKNKQKHMGNIVFSRHSKSIHPLKKSDENKQYPVNHINNTSLGKDVMYCGPMLLVLLSTKSVIQLQIAIAFALARDSIVRLSFLYVTRLTNPVTFLVF